MSDTNKQYTSEVKKLDKSQVEVTGEVASEAFLSYEQAAIEKLGKEVEVDGFRKGNVPKNILEKKLGEGAILQEMAEQALGAIYPSILEEHTIQAIGRPEISITKIARGNPLGFSIKTAVLPEFDLPDYKSLAKDAGTVPKDVTVTDEEIESTINQVRQMRARMEAQQKGEDAEKTEGDLPELDDAFVKTLGDFTSVDDFKKKIKENIALEKKNQEREKNRLSILDKIIEAADIDLPDIIVDAETNNLLHRVKGDIAQTGMEFDEYLKKLGKSEDDMRKELRPDAEKRAKMQLLINKIAVAENIAPDKEEVEKEVDVIAEKYKDADPHRVRSYVESTLLAEKVFQFLESQAGGEK